MSDIVLYEIVLSPFCEKVRRALDYKGIEYRRVECITWTNGRIKAMNPRRKFPFMEYKGNMLLDSTDILHAIEHDYPEPALVPKDERRRALTHLLEDWADESLFWYEVWFRFFPPETSRRIAATVVADLPAWVRPLVARIVPGMVRKLAVAQGVGRKPRNVIEVEVRRHYEMLATFLKDGPYLTGETLTSADIVASAMIWGLIDGGQGPAIREFPALMPWYERVTAETKGAPIPS